MRAIGSRQAQSGMVLVVAVVLLLLAGVLTLFALKVGLFEQRSTGNDLRSKVVADVAEAGLAQGFEYLVRQHADLLKTPAAWERCRGREGGSEPDRAHDACPRHGPHAAGAGASFARNFRSASNTTVPPKLMQ